MHVVIAVICSLLYSVILPAYSMCWPVSGCNVLCCRLFRRRVRCARSLSCTQLCRWSWWTHLPSKLPMLSYLDGLQPYYCNNYPFVTLVVISVWLNSAINPPVLCVSAILIQGWHLSTETTVHWDRVATKWYQSTRWLQDATTSEGVLD